MNQVDSIQLRRQLLEWRDKHVEHIQHHLNREITLLFQELDFEIEKMSLSDIFTSDDYAKKHLEPIYMRWIDNEAVVLINTAQSDLNTIYEHRLERQQTKSRLKYQGDSRSVVDASTAVLSTGVAVAAIPTIVSLSTTTVGAGGLLGFLGVTTTVVSWPIALVGGTIFLGLSYFGVNKAANLKSDAVTRFKGKFHKSIRELILHNKINNSVCQALQAKINGVAKTLLAEISK